MFMLITSLLANTLVFSLLSGIFNSHSPQPKYLSAWDVQVVPNFIKSTWGETDKLGGKDFSLKLCMLLIITTLSKGIRIHY